MENNVLNKNYGVPVAIVIAGLLIAAAIYFKPATPAAGVAGAPDKVNIKKVTAADHIRGNPKAPITIVEYSDLECPFCKVFHQTMQQVMAKYEAKGQVAWVYRHFPLYKGDSVNPPLHPKAEKEAEAAECAAELGGNDIFWKYVDQVFAVTPSNNKLDPAKLPEIAVNVGLDKTRFTACLNSGKYAKAIEASYNDAVAAGAQGTPFPIVITARGEQIALPGAVPFTNLDQFLTQLLAK